MEKNKKVKKTTVTPDFAKMDSTAKSIQYKITKAAVTGKKSEVKVLKKELHDLDKKAMAHPANQPTRFKNLYK
jgi:hypothetical protein